MNLRHLAPKASTLAKLSYTSILNCCAWLCSPSCKIVASRTFVCDALFCYASPSSLYLPPAAVACLTQSKHCAKLSYTSILNCCARLCSPSCKIVASLTFVCDALFCCASPSSLYLPPAAVACFTQSKHCAKLSYTSLKCFLFCFDIL